MHFAYVGPASGAEKATADGAAGHCDLNSVETCDQQAEFHDNKIMITR